ncbi:hypothetical protein [Pseudomonas syringae group genomosp. 3]|uniref:hypothetical protein n=1 Tax=Pseudomonas syringae group genomosp. 3 TaxID=251701 RepID=UPI001068232C|nr:hypothetical protein [Pseudomonas syringae group genomosp. 3]TES72581.1 hypothetical protein E2N89_28560 [Pseudomonas syringae pv. tomato]
MRKAHERLGNIVDLRGKYLRRLDTANGDRRTRIEKFKAIEAVEEQLLVRLDLATGVIGYLDMATGRYVLNTQRNIANDSNFSEAAFSRLLTTLEQVGYVYRRIERVRLDERDANGLHLVRTRVLIRFTKLFWADLGLRYAFEKAQKAARKRRKTDLNVIGQRHQREMEEYSRKQGDRQRSRERWEAKENQQPGASTSAVAAGRSSTAPERKNGPEKPIAFMERIAAKNAARSKDPG